MPGYLTQTGRHPRAAVLQELGLPTSVGLAHTKTLAKLANHIAKACDRKPEHYPESLRRLAQVCNFGEVSPTELATLMGLTDVVDVWGVGRKYAEKLRAGGVKTVLDLVRADSASVRREFSVVLEKSVRELRGTPCMSVDEAPAARQHMLVSRKVGNPVTDVEAIVEAVSEFASRAAEKLRQQDSVAGAIQVFFTTSPFRTNDRQHSPSLTVPLRSTADSGRLISAAVRATRQMFRSGFNYTKAGAMLLDLQDKEAAKRQGELDLFVADDEAGASAETKDRSALMEAMDKLNQRFGRGAVRIGSTTAARANDAGTATWAVRQDRRSPRYTTRWDEVPVVR